MTPRGIEGLIIETHNWGRAVAFWQGLGFKVEFETDHHSARLGHPGGGVYLFIVERPEGEPLEMQPLIELEDAEAFVPPASATVDQPFEPRHWAVQEMVLRDPDGRRLSVQAPLPEGTEVPVSPHQ